MRLDSIKGALQDAEAAKVAAKVNREKKIEDILDYVCNKIEENMSLDTETNKVFAGIDRKDLTSDFWEKFEFNGLMFKIRLPEALNERLGQGVKVTFNSLSYGKEVDYVFFRFAVELD